MSFQDRLENSDIIASMFPFYHRKTIILHAGGRITPYASDHRNQEFLEKHSTHYNVILPHKALLTQAVVLKAHQRNLCTSASFVRVISNEQFCIPRAQMTIKTITNKCSVCMLAKCSTKKIEPPTGNIQNFLILNKVGDEKNRPYKVICYDIKVPIIVDNDRKFKKVRKKISDEEDEDDEIQALKAYILSATCAMTCHSSLEVTEDRSYESIKLAILKIFYEQGTSRVMIRDIEAAFRAIEKDLSEKDSKNTREMIEGWKVSEQKVDLETAYGTKFVFQHGESHEYIGLIKRMHMTISQSMLSFKQADLILTQFTTIVKGLQAMLNKRTLGGMNKENTDEIEFVTPSMLLTGYDINVCPNCYLPKVEKRMIQNRTDIVRYTRPMKALYSRIWGKLILTYVKI